jgi:oxazoline/thiazoline dehydrogenase
MDPGVIQWTFRLASDVRIERIAGGATLRTSVSKTAIRSGAELRTIERLAGDGATEIEIQRRLGSREGSDDETQSAALLFRLDRLGLLARGLNWRGCLIASCEPGRPPSRAMPEHPPAGPLRLAPNALARVEGGAICIESPGSWARVIFHEREFLPLLQDLAAGGRSAEAIVATAGDRADPTTGLLALMSWCELLDQGDHQGAPGHELLFHVRTRRGYGRAFLGKIHSADPIVDASAQPGQAIPRIVLERPDMPRLLAEDPPFALVSERRRSERRQGAAPVTLRELSEFLFRTLRDRGGSRPYPSAGARYPLDAYLVAHRCLELPRGLYAYSSGRHELSLAAEAGPALDQLLMAAAGAAEVDEAPQVLLVLAARFDRVRPMYGDLGYSLILKEVGAIFQAAMMAAAAMGLAACPLGCGDSVLFSKLIGVSPDVATSVGEMMLGSIGDRAAR